MKKKIFIVLSVILIGILLISSIKEETPLDKEIIIEKFLDSTSSYNEDNSKQYTLKMVQYKEKTEITVHKNTHNEIGVKFEVTGVSKKGNKLIIDIKETISINDVKLPENQIERYGKQAIMIIPNDIVNSYSKLEVRVNTYKEYGLNQGFQSDKPYEVTKLRGRLK